MINPKQRKSTKSEHTHKPKPPKNKTSQINQQPRRVKLQQTFKKFHSLRLTKLPKARNKSTRKSRLKFCEWPKLRKSQNPQNYPPNPMHQQTTITKGFLSHIQASWE